MLYENLQIYPAFLFCRSPSPTSIVEARRPQTPHILLYGAAIGVWNIFTATPTNDDTAGHAGLYAFPNPRQ